MPWHSHSDSDINASAAPKPVAQQKSSNTSSAASSAGSGIASLIGLGQGIAKKVKGSKTPGASGGSYDSGD